MIGWTMDILVGWIAGSVVLGLLFGVVEEFAGGGKGFETAGVLIGTVLGIALMRRARTKRKVTP